MLKLGSINQKISKKLLMLSGISFTPNLICSSNLGLKLSFQDFQSVTSPHNTSPTEISSALVEYKRMIFKELPKPLELSYKQLLEMDCWKMFLDHADNSRRFSSEMKDLTCSLNVIKQNQAPLFCVVVPANILKRPKDPSTTLSWLLGEHSSLKPSLPVEVPLKWSFQDIWENILEQLRESNSLSSTASPKPLKQSQEPSLKTVVWTLPMYSTNSDKSTLKEVKMEYILASMFLKIALMTCIKNLCGNLKKFELMFFKPLLKLHALFWA